MSDQLALHANYIDDTRHRITEPTEQRPRNDEATPLLRVLTGVGTQALAGEYTGAIVPADKGTQLLRRELIVVDPSVANYEELLSDITQRDEEIVQRDEETVQRDGGTRYRVLILDPDRDGVEQISEALNDMGAVHALHLISHGDDGSVQLANSRLDLAALSLYENELTGWRDALAPGADILIYGCDVAGSDGEAFLHSFADMTGADIAASDDLTGSAELGGDWDLEFELGQIETQLAPSTEAQQQWDGTLATFTVDTTADTEYANHGDGIAEDSAGNVSLRADIMEANAMAGDEVILLYAATTYLLTLPGAGETTAETDALDVD